MAVVTALRARGGRVAVELDGRPWRTLPLEAVVRAGLAEGCELHRERARALARERRRLRALDLAARALRSRDRSERELVERLAARGVPPAERQETLATLQRVGLVDDTRLAAGRATTLAERGYGDAAIRDDLERRGLSGEAVADALASLEPEPERAAALIGRFGGGLRGARALARRGFGDESVEALIAGDEDGAVG
jgi:SOS response regulatory protein OraA/RecX